MQNTPQIAGWNWNDVLTIFTFIIALITILFEIYKHIKSIKESKKNVILKISHYKRKIEGRWDQEVQLLITNRSNHTVHVINYMVYISKKGNEDKMSVGDFFANIKLEPGDTKRCPILISDDFQQDIRIGRDVICLAVVKDSFDNEYSSGQISLLGSSQA